MCDEYEFLVALSKEADEEVRSQIRLICENPASQPTSTRKREPSRPRRLETSRLAAH